MERFLKENFDLPAKNPSEEVQRRWRNAVGQIVRNRKRRFRMVADLDKRSEDEARRRSIQGRVDGDLGLERGLGRGMAALWAHHPVLRILATRMLFFYRAPF